MPLRDHLWCILVAKYGAFLFTEIGAFVITDYMGIARLKFLIFMGCLYHVKKIGLEAQALLLLAKLVVS